MKKNIIISGINLFEGGPLSIISDFLSSLNSSRHKDDFNFIALVHKKSLFTGGNFNNIEFLEFPKSRKSYLYRLYYEYIYFKKLANERNACYWISLHDITPNLKNVIQVVYCHNPSPFNTVNYKDFFRQPTYFFFRLFYKYLYKINIKKNEYVIVQQLWIKHRFVNMFNLNPRQIIIAPPKVPTISKKYTEPSKNKPSSKKTFFFPTYPRPFKNIEVICEAIKRLPEDTQSHLQVIITIDGYENQYSKFLLKKYRRINSINFIGLLSRERVYDFYANSDVLIFPSKLETWGLPISEFKQFNKPIFVSNLPYALETVGDYNQVSFFDPNDVKKLSMLIENAVYGKFNFEKTKPTTYESPIAKDWEELIKILLK